MKLLQCTREPGRVELHKTANVDPHQDLSFIPVLVVSQPGRQLYWNLPSRFFNKPKRFCRIITRYDELLASYEGFVQVAAIAILLR